jgi:hypothetical protein
MLTSKLVQKQILRNKEKLQQSLDKALGVKPVQQKPLEVTAKRDNT